MFDWHVLPVAGGLWDQDPVWLESVRVINSVIAEYERAEEKRKANREKWKKEGYPD